MILGGTADLIVPLGGQRFRVRSRDVHLVTANRPRLVLGPTVVTRQGQRVLDLSALAADLDPKDGYRPARPFQQPHYMLVNLAIGGTQGGDPSQTEFPSRYEVDYIRVYQKK